MTLKLLNQITSKPYIELTLQLMNQFGVHHSWIENEIRIDEQRYEAINFSVEADWSGASYWYAMAALSDQCNLLLKGLRLESLQGDSSQSEWFREYFGVLSVQEGNNVRLTKITIPEPKNIAINFIENPDIAQTFVVLAVCKKIPFHFKGLLTLKIKETNRILALQQEISKFGATLDEPSNGDLAWNGTIDQNLVEYPPVIKTYHDHRMALAFAPAAMVYPQIGIEDPEVITKSYPGYWDDLRKIGFEIVES